MYSPDFDYYRARSVKDAQQLLAAHPGAKLLAGGHSLLPLMKLRLAAPAAVVDIGRVAELRGISREGLPSVWMVLSWMLCVALAPNCGSRAARACGLASTAASRACCAACQLASFCRAC